MIAWTRYAPLLILAALWEGTVRSGLVSPDLLPSLTSVLAAGWQLLKEGELWPNAAASLTRGGAGLLLAVLIGGTRGILMAGWRPVDALLGPLVEMLSPMP